VSFLDDMAGDLMGGSRTRKPTRVRESAPAPRAPKRKPAPPSVDERPSRGAVRLLVHVAAIDAEGRRVVERKAFDVPESVVKSHGVLTESAEDLLGVLASSAAGGAMKSMMPSSPAGGGAADVLSATDPESTRITEDAAKSLGLDIIEHMDAVERGEVSPSSQGGGGPPAWAQQSAAPRMPQRSMGPHTTGPRPPR
jgi:hypothetical protein